jgi:hypothetical protein
MGLPIEKDVDLGGGVMLRLVLIPAGRFIMGSPYSEVAHQWGGDNDETRHGVTITRPYYLGKVELTQAQWQAVMGDNPSTFKGIEYPVESVGWTDAAVFCEKAAGKLGLPIRLPTEAEWEFACRAGTTGAFGESSEIKALDAAGWYGGNSGARLHRVGEKSPNRWGLYDMRGNVWEWCQDWAGPFSNEPVSDPQGPAPNQYEDRVLRGGCWRNAPGFCRSAARDFDALDDRSGFVGFRVAMDATSDSGFHQGRQTRVGGPWREMKYDLRAYTLGEHGDSQFPVFSLAVAGGTRIAETDATHEVFRQASRSGFEVVRLKGHTNYTIGMAAALVIEAIAWDTRRTMPLSVRIDGFLGVRDVCLSLPVVVGRSGITRVLEPKLGDEEAAAFRRCAEIVREAIRQSAKDTP